MNLIEPDWSDSGLVLLAMLVAGHVFADFLFQTRKMVERKKGSLGALALHAVFVTLIQGALVLPFSWSPRSAALVGLVGLTHYVIDALKNALARTRPYPFRWFALDQVSHLAVLVFVASQWPYDDGVGLALPVWGAPAAVVLAVYVFNWTGGSAVVSLLFEELRRGEAPPVTGNSLPGVGRVIGILERTLIVTLVWSGQWGAVGFVLAAKSIARFKELEKQEFAEIYLVGTMTSVMVAIASGGLLAWLL